LRNALARVVAPVVALALMAGLPVHGAARRQSDLDEFMAKVLAQRDENWKKLRQYVLDDHEQVEVVGPAGARLWGDRRDYTWFIRDGFFVRSPTKANGTTVSDADRRQYEDDYLKRAKARERRGPVKDGAPPAPDAPSSIEGLISQTRQPGFIDSAYFLRFKFEGGKYALVGRETLDGSPVLRIEYYPTRLFSHEQDAEARGRQEPRGNRDREVEATTERMFNKVSLVTLWVNPDAHQIVKYTFDNIDLDFLPAAWMLRVTDLRATMTMGQPFAGVWLPHGVEMVIKATLAVGGIELRYRLGYDGYREAQTSGRIVPTGAP
jgi:hypothetical protein